MAEHVSSVNLQGGGDDEKREKQREDRRQNDENNSDQNLVRLHRGLRTAVTPALKTLFKKLWDDENQEQPWGWTKNDVETLTNKVDKRTKIKLHRKFDEFWKACNWDISKLALAIIDCKVLKRINGDGELSDHVRGLRDIRNKVAHDQMCFISDKDFQKVMQNIIDHITFLEVIIDLKPYVKILSDLKQEHKKEQNFKKPPQFPSQALIQESVRSVSVICDEYKEVLSKNQTPTTCSENDKSLQSDSPKKITNKDLSPVGQSFPESRDSDAYSNTVSTQKTDVVHSSTYPVNSLEFNNPVYKNSWRLPMRKVPFDNSCSNSSNFTQAMLNAASEKASASDSSSVLSQSLSGSQKYSDRNFFSGDIKIEERKHTITSQAKMHLTEKGSFEPYIRQENSKNVITCTSKKAVPAVHAQKLHSPNKTYSKKVNKELEQQQRFHTDKLQRGQADGLECEIKDNTNKLQRDQPDGLEYEIEDKTDPDSSPFQEPEAASKILLDLILCSLDYINRVNSFSAFTNIPYLKILMDFNEKECDISIAKSTDALSRAPFWSNYHIPEISAFTSIPYFKILMDFNEKECDINIAKSTDTHSRALFWSNYHIPEFQDKMNIDTFEAKIQNKEKTNLPNNANKKGLRNNFENKQNELALSMQKPELFIRQLQTENRKLEEERKELRVKLEKEDLDKKQIKDEIDQLRKELKDCKEAAKKNEKENASLLEQQQSHIEQLTEELKNTKLANIRWQEKAEKAKMVQDRETDEKPGDENVSDGDDEFRDESLSWKKQTAKQSSKQRETKLQLASVEDGAVGGETYDEVLMTGEKAIQGEQNGEHGEKRTVEEMKLKLRTTIVKILGRELKATQGEKNREHGENMTVEKMKLEHKLTIVKILDMELESLRS